MVAEFLLGSLAWWTIAIAIGYLPATVSMGYYLCIQHPKLRKVLKSNPLDRTM